MADANEGCADSVLKAASARHTAISVVNTTATRRCWYLAGMGKLRSTASYLEKLLLYDVALNSGWAYREQVERANAGRLVLAHLVASQDHSSPQEWAARIERGEVELDGVRAALDTTLRTGQLLVWHRPPWDEPESPMHYEVLHEDEAILAVIKPSGLQTMPAGGFLEHTLMTLVRRTYPEASPMHRLGRFTSGIVLFARTSEAGRRLTQAWRGHEVKKQYRALGQGVALHERYEIDTPIGPVPHPVLGAVHAASPSGKPSHTIANVIERREDHTLFSVDITTGRPHQIRIHLAVAGHPLVGDSVYDIGGGLKPSPGLPGDGGYLLHAERLQFLHPTSGVAMSLVAQPPAELRSRRETPPDQ